jgi:hypothetical protein
VTSFPPRIAIPVAFVYAFVLITGGASGAYAARHVEPAGGFLFLYVGILTAIGYWLMWDSKRYGLTWAWDMGFFLYLAWPLIMPYYLLKTRGVKSSILITLAIIGTYVVGEVITLIMLKT